MVDPDIDTNRLQFYERSYDNITGTDEINENEELISMILKSLHDNWSEIRKMSYKKLIKLRRRFSNILVANLLSVLLCFDDLSWQHLHGNLLGIRAVLPMVKSIESLTEIQQKLLETLSHFNLPVREVAAGALLDLMKNDPSKIPEHLYFLLHQIEPKARVDSYYCTEHHSHFLYASLGLVADLLKSSPLLSSDFTSSYLNILGLCLMHNSTTVRIQATQTVKAMYDQSCPMFTFDTQTQETLAYSPDTSIINCLGTIIETANGTISKANDWRQWRVLEGFLLIIEDILLRLSLSSSLLLSFTSQLPHPLIATFLSVIPPLHSALPCLVSHPVFEITRLLSQILPSLGRVSVLYSLHNPSSLLCSPLPTACPPEVQHIWELEVIKSLCLLLEAFPSKPPTEVSHQPNSLGEQDLERNLLLASLSSLSFAMTTPRWSSIIRRRLGEADRQKLFIQFISSPSICTHLSSLFSPSAQQWMNSISQFCDHLFLVLASQNSLGILSLDSIQLIAHLVCLTSSLSDSYASNDDFPLLMTYRKLFHSLLSFLLTFQSQVDQLPESLLSACSHTHVELSNSWVYVDTLTSSQHLTMKEQLEDPSTQTSTDPLIAMNFTKFRDEKLIPPLLFQRHLWEMLTPLLPLLLNPRLVSYLLNGSRESPSEVSSTSLEFRAEVYDFLDLILLNSSVINNWQSVTDILWIGCYHITLLNLSLSPSHHLTGPTDCLSSNLLDILRKSQYFRSLEIELQSSFDHSASKLDCQVISLVLMIEKFMSLAEKRQELLADTKNLRDLITGRSTTEVRKKHVGEVEEDEFSDWDDSDNESGSTTHNHSGYAPMLATLLEIHSGILSP